VTFLAISPEEIATSYGYGSFDAGVVADDDRGQDCPLA
jgi:hypothetical protein